MLYWWCTALLLHSLHFVCKYQPSLWPICFYKSNCVDSVSWPDFNLGNYISPQTIFWLSIDYCSTCCISSPFRIHFWCSVVVCCLKVPSFWILWKSIKIFSLLTHSAYWNLRGGNVFLCVTLLLSRLQLYKRKYIFKLKPRWNSRGQTPRTFVTKSIYKAIVIEY